MIIVKDLCFDYPGKRALNQVSFSIESNTVTGLVGPNGAGKTTLLRCLSALDSPMSGHILIEGWDTDRHPRKVHALCRYLPDFFGLYDELSVQQNLTFFAWSHGASRAEVSQLVIETAKNLNLETLLTLPAGQLSRGQRQRLAIAQTLIYRPNILFLDEPAAGLDPEARYDLSKLILRLKTEGMTLIVSSHILSELEDYCTHMIVMNEGRIIEQCALSSTPSVDITSKKRMQDVYLNIIQKTKSELKD